MIYMKKIGSLSVQYSVFNHFDVRVDILPQRKIKAITPRIIAELRKYCRLRPEIVSLSFVDGIVGRNDTKHAN